MTLAQLTPKTKVWYLKRNQILNEVDVSAMTLEANQILFNTQQCHEAFSLQEYRSIQNFGLVQFGQKNQKSFKFTKL